MYFFGRPQDVIVFIVGGTTYEEARIVSLQNATNSGIRFILGGSAILNSKRYVRFGSKFKLCFFFFFFKHDELLQVSSLRTA